MMVSAQINGLGTSLSLEASAESDLGMHELRYLVFLRYKHEEVLFIVLKNRMSSDRAEKHTSFVI